MKKIPLLLLLAIILTGCTVPERHLANCGKTVIDIEIICKDGLDGCSKKYLLEGGGYVLVSNFGNKETNNEGKLCDVVRY